MKRLWLLLLPFLFLPDLGTGTATGMGTTELADYLIIPYVVMVYIAGRSDGFGAWRTLVPLLIGFIGWALVSTLTINLRYGYSAGDFVAFGLVKVGKMLAYGLAGFFTARALEDDLKARMAYPWALLGCAVFLAGSLVHLRSLPRTAIDEARIGFQSSNAISVALAMLLCWMVTYLGIDRRTPAWRTAVALSSPLLLVGFSFSDGRGGWVAALVGGAYAAWRLGVRPTLVAAGLVGVLLLWLTYENEPGFRHQVDMTLDPSQLQMASDFARTTGVDDGQRLGIWVHEAPKVLLSPIFGSGMYHRGFRSTLWESGSHNFWIQMFLETGLVGGTLVLVLMRRMWRMSGSLLARSANLDLATRAGLIAAFMGGMTGEYFYGGKPLLVLLLIVAPCLSLPKDVPVAEPVPPPRPRLQRVPG